VTVSRTLTAALLIALLSLALLLSAVYLHHTSAPSTTPRSPGTAIRPVFVRRALVADALHDMFPNNSLLHLLVSTLSSAGYVVEVRLGSNVTPDLFRNLTQYSLVILRLHGGYGVRRGGERVGGLFTGVKWNYRFYRLALEGYVAKGIPFYAREKAYVALLPRFFKERLRGSFHPNSTVVALGCYTALDPGVAKAMFSHGLRYFIGFRREVSVEYIDRAAIALAHLLVEGVNPIDAVSKVNSSLGPDPSTGEELVVYTAQ